MSILASNDDLIHYGVLGMEWGVRRDNMIRDKVDKYSTISRENAYRAEEEAAKRINGSKYLERSNRYMKKATNRKLQSVIDWNDYYIFGSISTKYSGKAPEFILENPIAVSKSSKIAFTFNPLIH